MKKMIIAISVAATCVILGTSALADPEPSQEMDVVELIEKLHTFYKTKMQSKSGRQLLHGKCEEVLDAQNFVSIEKYEDGEVYTNDLKKTAQQKVEASNKRLKIFTDANGFPRELARMRERNLFAKTNTVEVSVNITAGK